jgi:hypothetical protein
MPRLFSRFKRLRKRFFVSGFCRHPLGSLGWVGSVLFNGFPTWYKRAQKMTIDELKALGAPWPAAEVQISVQNKITRLVFLVRDGDGFRAFDDFALDFPWHVNADFHDADALAKVLIAYAEQLGLLVPRANAEIVDLDG